MNTTLRSAFLATAFAATVAAAITGFTLRGETREFVVAEACEQVAWPMIPAHCLDGGNGKDVRTINIDAPATDPSMKLRFDVAFNRVPT
jgi:hypothetical protein